MKSNRSRSRHRKQDSNKDSRSIGRRSRRNYDSRDHRYKRNDNQSEDRSYRRKHLKYKQRDMYYLKGGRQRSKSSRHKRHKRRDRSESRNRSRRTMSYSESCRKSSSSPQYPHYKFKPNQLLGRKYKVRQILGDGTFGRVVQAEYDGRLYAVKIVKAVPRYIESAKTEKSIIRFINSKDPEDKEGIVRYVDSFHHFSNYCIVFKPLGKSLYDVLKMNKYKGFPLNLVQSFFRQILKSVGFMHRVGYTHTDLKPENVLLEENRFKRQNYAVREGNSSILLPENDRVRIIDFGGATEQHEHHSKTINTRQYRSPEVIMSCCQWQHISDVWSIGCIIIELYIGELYFETHQNVQHLRMIEKHGGPYPEWMINRSSEFRHCFKQGLLDWPRVAHQTNSIQRVHRMKTLKQLFPQEVQLRELLQQCLQVDPRKRISCQDALRHRFFSIVY